jgi:predicted metal-dependent hydrolase
MLLEIDGVPIEITRKNIKRLNLRIHPPDGAVRVSAPKHYNNALIYQLLHEKIDWITTHRNKIRERHDNHIQDLKSGATIPFLGDRYPIFVTEHAGIPHIEFIDNVIQLRITHGYTTSDIEKHIERWYRKNMLTIVPELMNHWKKVINVEVRDWYIRKMKTRWGSCNTKEHRICLNLNLMTTPLACLEYVIVHELVHLLEASHNARFYELMTVFMPNWREYKRQLAQC